MCSLQEEEEEEEDLYDQEEGHGHAMVAGQAGGILECVCVLCVCVCHHFCVCVCVSPLRSPISICMHARCVQREGREHSKGTRARCCWGREGGQAR